MRRLVNKIREWFKPKKVTKKFNLKKATVALTLKNNSTITLTIKGRLDEFGEYYAKYSAREVFYDWLKYGTKYGFLKTYNGTEDSQYINKDEVSSIEYTDERDYFVEREF